MEKLTGEMFATNYTNFLFFCFRVTRTTMAEDPSLPGKDSSGFFLGAHASSVPWCLTPGTQDACAPRDGTSALSAPLR
ncbi:MAG: hypothetical protein DMG08_08865 [Acidobacteria bacterium]|nr:MAG: hypothetical protein DMG08_08865 [Acidobacteriota bacterium]